MVGFLSKRSALWIVFLVHTSYLWFTWTIYEQHGREEPVLIVLVGLLLLICFLVVSALRCRELNWSAWRVVALYVPVAGLILLLLLLFRKTNERQDQASENLSRK
ncbi:MAG: DUF805 domain-containing protein [Pseudomonadales bacterium]|nr:DUF805 domain-containing protein [Pseudomonadales bacterium]